MDHSLPCLTNKCILLPVCKAKFEIECKVLSDYYGEATDTTYNSYDRETWNEIEKVLPKLLEIHGPVVQTKTLKYRTYIIYKYPDPGNLEFKQTPEEI